jgi:hypothetical protein
MIEVLITSEMRRSAQRKADDLGHLRNSILKGQGNFTGFLGEEVALSVLGGTLTNTYDYDLIDKDNTKIDVKTKLTSVKPLEYFECSVAAYNTKQQCDKYAFVRISKDFTRAWFLGTKLKKDYFEQATFLKKGDIDGSNNFEVRADCYNLPINKLEEVTN